MSGDLGNSFDMPFEEGGQGPLLDDHVHYSGGLVVMAAAVDVPDYGKKPALVFRFARIEGGFYPAVVLITDDDQLAKTPPLVSAAVDAARKAAEASS